MSIISVQNLSKVYPVADKQPGIAGTLRHFGTGFTYQRFAQAGLTAILGSGFDPGVTGVFTAYALKHYFDEILDLDIVDCNAGSHGRAFATNFNPEINIREITQEGQYYEKGDWVTVPPLSVHRPIHYPNIGERESYLLYHAV